MPSPIALFAITTLIPVPLLLLGAVFGGIWIVLAILYLGAIAFALDEWVPVTVELTDERSFPAADQLSVVLGVAHFILLLVGLWAMTGGTGLGWSGMLAVFLGYGLFFGQISNSNAHELIHRSDKRLFQLGMWVYISLLFGHHTSAHRHVHHRFVATDEDPSTAQMDESFYDFAPRAWAGSFRAGYEMEQALTGRLSGQGGKRRLNPYVMYVGGGVGFFILFLLLFGPGVLIAYPLLTAYAQAQLLMSDYVQHYGLTRRRLPDGKTEAVGIAHSWNAAHWFTGLMMLNAPHHSAHHAHPARAYPALDLPAANAAPTLPYSLPTMAVLALHPRIWRKVMNPRAQAWRNVTTAADI